MPRKGPAPKRKLIPDPVFSSELVTRFINRLLLGGKRSTAERIFYGAMDAVEQRAGAPAIEVFERAMRT
jgi:small subunit ribosomal protein S7